MGKPGSSRKDKLDPSQRTGQAPGAAGPDFFHLSMQRRNLLVPLRNRLVPLRERLVQNRNLLVPLRDRLVQDRK